MKTHMHLHKPDWHTLSERLEHMIHDPRFWAALALGVLLVMMILSIFLTKPGAGQTKWTAPPQMYPFVP